MYKFETSDARACATMRDDYLNSLYAPKDGMWESFVDMGSFFLVKKGGEIIGYLVLNQDNYLIQIYARADATEVFASAIKELGIVGSFVATSEPDFLRLSQEQQKSVAVNAHMYYVPKDVQMPKPGLADGSEFRVLSTQDFEGAVLFALDVLGAPEDWLRGYYAERIERGELYGLYQDGKLIAAGECRLSPMQENIADLGMVVAPAYRKKGIATEVLGLLLEKCEEEGWTPICSTENDNIGAQKAIQKAGFVPYHRILQIKF